MVDDMPKMKKRIQGLLILIGILIGGVLILLFSIQEKVRLQEARTSDRADVSSSSIESNNADRELTEEERIEMNLRLDDLNLEI